MKDLYVTDVADIITTFNISSPNIPIKGSKCETG